MSLMLTQDGRVASLPRHGCAAPSNLLHCFNCENKLATEHCTLCAVRLRRLCSHSHPPWRLRAGLMAVSACPFAAPPLTLSFHAFCQRTASMFSKKRLAENTRLSRHLTVWNRTSEVSHPLRPGASRLPSAAHPAV